MPACRICLGRLTDESAYHAACLESLFGVAAAPSLDLEPSRLYAMAAEMAGKMSISGVQEKVSLRLSEDRRRLDVAATGGRYILKPEPARFAHLPENEQLTMRLAALAGIEVPPFGLVELKGGVAAYLVKRFDRLDNGAKLHVEDFCQLDERPTRDKYHGSGEGCVRVLRRHASEPLIEIRKLFKRLLFSWWVSNGDQHLKNFSLMVASDGFRRLSPAYDLVCTRLPIPTDRDLALTIRGKRSDLSLRDWLEFASYCGIPEKAAAGLIQEQVLALEPTIKTIWASFLPADLKNAYERIVRENTTILSQQC